MLDAAALVIDLGSGTVKAELAGAEAPRFYRNAVGVPKYRHLLSAPKALGAPTGDVTGPAAGSVLRGPGAPGAAGGGGSYIVGPDLERLQGVVHLERPMEHGTVHDWSQQRAVLQYVTRDLGVAPTEHPAVVTEAPLTGRAQRARLAQVLMEEQRHPALLFAVPGVLCLYAAGQTSGIVLDVGDGVAHSSAVFEGFSLHHATQRADLGGRDVTMHLQTLLRRDAGVALDRTTTEREVADAVKRQCCEVALTSSGSAATPSADAVRHVLPDGSEIALGRERFAAPELLFNPHGARGLDCRGVQQLVLDTVKACDMEIRTALLSSVYMAGGTTLLPNFGARLAQELAHETPHTTKVRVHSPSERQALAWLGGSFLSQLSTFGSMLVTAAEYKEQGDRIFATKLFQ